MSELSKQQVQELHDAILDRLQEFELPMPSAVLLTKGATRIAYDVIGAFIREQMSPCRDEAEDKRLGIPGGWQQGYEEGYAEAIRTQEWAAAHADDVVEPAPTNGNGSEIVNAEIAAAFDADDDPYNIRGMLASGPLRASSEKPDAPPIAPPQAPIGISPSAAATLGPEHTVVTPLKAAGRTLAEVDADLSDLKLDSEIKADHLREIIGELQMISQNGEMPTMAEYDKRKPLHLPKSQTALSRYRLSWGRLAEYANLKYEGRGQALV